MLALVLVSATAFGQKKKVGLSTAEVKGESHVHLEEKVAAMAEK